MLDLLLEGSRLSRLCPCPPLASLSGFSNFHEGVLQRAIAPCSQDLASIALSGGLSGGVDEGVTGASASQVKSFLAPGVRSVVGFSDHQWSDRVCFSDGEWPKGLPLSFEVAVRLAEFATGLSAECPFPLSVAKRKRPSTGNPGEIALAVRGAQRLLVGGLLIPLRCARALWSFVPSADRSGGEWRRGR
jgi:hypothetical protein